jgi:MFS family permease
MKDRIKWMLVGLGFTFGLQVIISLIFTAISFSASGSETGVPQDTILVVSFALVFGAFLIGGFVMGWMSEQQRILDAIVVAIITFALSLLIYMALPEANKGQFVTGYLLDDVRRAAISFVIAIIAATIGAYWGGHVTVPQEGTLDRVALLVGLIGAVVGPFVLLAVGGRDPANPNQPNLPWYFLAIVLVLVLVIVGVGFVLFTRESHYEEEISISPETRREHTQ